MARLERLDVAYEVDAAVHARPATDGLGGSGAPGRIRPGGSHELRKLFSPRLDGDRLVMGRLAARGLLGGALRDGERVRLLRRLASERGLGAAVARLTDHEVVDWVASRIGSAELRAFRAPVPPLNLPYEPPAEVDDAVGPESVVESEFLVAGVEALSEEEAILPLLEVDPEPAEIEPSFEGPFEPVETDSLDAAAQAETLRDAAAAGVPFCEECERARLAQQAAEQEAKEAEQEADEQAAASDDEAQALDAAAQASVLQSAASSGAPFCEECEKAKQAAAAQGGD